MYERRTFLSGVAGTAAACLAGCLGGSGGGSDGAGPFPVLSEPSLAEYVDDGRDEAAGRTDAAELGYTDHASLSDHEAHLPDRYASLLGEPAPSAENESAEAAFESVDTVGTGIVETRRYGGDEGGLVGLASGRVELTNGTYDQEAFRTAMSLDTEPDDEYDGYDIHYSSTDGDDQTRGFALGDGTLLYGSGHASIPRYVVDRAEGGSPASWIQDAVGRAEPFDIGVVNYDRTTGSIEQSTGVAITAFDVAGARTTHRWIAEAPDEDSFQATWDEDRHRRRYEDLPIDDLSVETRGSYGIVEGTIDTASIESFD